MRYTEKIAPVAGALTALATLACCLPMGFAAAAVRVFAVWEPILVTDLAPPINAVLRRMPDRRVQQYWDPHHLIAKQMAADARPPQPEHECCLRSGVLWDLAALYPKGATWTERMPAATVFNGPVVDLTDPLSAAIGAQR